MLKRACTTEQLNERKKEIIDATSKMFDTIDYQDISMKTISERISIARSSLYCYYNTKEEIMLDVLKDEYISWLVKMIDDFKHDYKTIDDLAEEITLNYLSNKKMLKIVSIYLTDIEIHSSLEKLIEFKNNFKDLLKDLYISIESYFNTSSKENIENLYNSLIMLSHSLYAMIEPNPNQKKAMETVGLKTIEDAHAFTFNEIMFLLSKMI